MKNRTTKFLTAVALVCVMTVTGGWTSASPLSDFVTHYLAREEFGATGADANVAKLLKVKHPSLLKKFKAAKQTKATQKKTNAHCGSIDVYYSNTQNGNPYMDTNLKVSINNTQIDYFFFNEFGEYHDAESCSVDLEIVCPIYEQWQAAGTMAVDISSWDPVNFIWTSVYSTTISHSPADTPDTHPNFFTKTVTLYGGLTYFVSVQSY